ncbi:MAG: energy-coupling factor ABC transporter ATP-binding protein [Deltaproteobacteria bacterium]|nr:energy-coupling factor ABC transporter ATP-binding protein [Deltaproteobacteria bacterium]
MTALLQIDNLSYTYPGGTQAALAGVGFSLDAGQCLCLCGPSGCGKTTLLRAVQGLLENGSLTGCLELNGPRPGMVFQNVDTQLLCTTVSDEVAFAPQNLGLSQTEVDERRNKALAAVGLENLAQRNVEELSAGQKQRVCLAAILAMEPKLLILDEPMAQLDQAGRAALVQTLLELKQAGHAILISEHNTGPLAHLADEYGVLDAGGGWQGVSPRPPAPPEPIPLPPNGSNPQSNPIAQARGLVLEGRDGPVLSGADISLLPGQRVHLFGPNGAGKTSLLRCLAGMLRPQEGRLEVAGHNPPKPENVFGQVGYLFQNPQRQLFEETVRAEVAFTLQRMGLPPTEVAARVEEALAMCQASHLADRPPLALSWGEQHRVALASVLAPRPRLLLCDEPMAGLDWAQRRDLLAVLARLAGEHGSTVLIASHDPLSQPDWAQLSLLLQGGRLVRN